MGKVKMRVGAIGSKQGTMKIEHISIAIASKWGRMDGRGIGNISEEAGGVQTDKPRAGIIDGTTNATEELVERIFVGEGETGEIKRLKKQKLSSSFPIRSRSRELRSFVIGARFLRREDCGNR
jgi:hypothetical protein